MPKLTKFRFKLPGGDWVDLGTHEVPDDIDPQDYFSFTLAPADVPVPAEFSMDFHWFELPNPTG